MSIAHSERIVGIVWLFSNIDLYLDLALIFTRPHIGEVELPGLRQVNSERTDANSVRFQDEFPRLRKLFTCDLDYIITASISVL